MNNILKGVGALFIIFFLSIYFSKYNTNYYENKSLLTDKAISQDKKKTAREGQ